MVADGSSRKIRRKIVRPAPSEKPQEKKPEIPLQVQASVDERLGKYSNLAMIHHTRLEFVVDFLLTVGNENILASRLITSPQHAKRLFIVLGKNIEHYEKKFGEIKLE